MCVYIYNYTQLCKYLSVYILLMFCLQICNKNTPTLVCLNQEDRLAILHVLKIVFSINIMSDGLSWMSQLPSS